MSYMAKLDEGLVGALRAGPDVLPNDLSALAECLRTIAILLAEKAGELEPSWSEARAVAAEVETLLDLEAAVAARAAAIPAATIDDVRTKLAIWKALVAGSEGEAGDPAGVGMILSIEADLDRLARDAAAP